MVERVKVMFVGSQGFRAAPGHVAHQIIFASFNLSRSLGRLTNQANFLRDEPVAQGMDVQIELEDCT